MSKTTERERVEASLRRLIKTIGGLHAKYGNIDLTRPVVEQPLVMARIRREQQRKRRQVGH